MLLKQLCTVFEKKYKAIVLLEWLTVLLEWLTALLEYFDLLQILFSKSGGWGIMPPVSTTYVMNAHQVT